MTWIYGHGVYSNRTCTACEPGVDRSLWDLLDNLDTEYFMAHRRPTPLQATRGLEAGERAQVLRDMLGSDSE